MNDLAELRLLGLQVPEELGGRGENHVCVSMVAETIARYGCPSTAMVYCEWCFVWLCVCGEGVGRGKGKVEL